MSYVVCCCSRRRVLLLTTEGESTFRSIQLVDPAGQDISGLAVEVSVGIEDGLPFEEVVRFAFSKPGITPCTWLANLDREDLIEWIGAISEAKMEAIEDALDSAGAGHRGAYMGDARSSRARRVPFRVPSENG